LTKVFDAGLHGQKTLTKFLIENFDGVNGALHITYFIILYRKQEIVLIVGNAQKT
jgi:hypothetical protein